MNSYQLAPRQLRNLENLENRRTAPAEINNVGSQWGQSQLLTIFLTSSVKSWDRPLLSAQNIAAQTVRTDVRRRAREQEAAAMNELFATEPHGVWEHIAP